MKLNPQIITPYKPCNRLFYDSIMYIFAHVLGDGLVNEGFMPTITSMYIFR